MSETLIPTYSFRFYLDYDGERILQQRFFRPNGTDLWQRVPEVCHDDPPEASPAENMLDELERTIVKNVGLSVARMTPEMRQRYRDVLGPSPETHNPAQSEAEFMRQKAISNARERNAAERAVQAALDDFDLIVERIDAGQIDRARGTAFQGAKEARRFLADNAAEASDNG